MKLRLLGCVCVCVLAVAACGGDNSTTGDGGPDGSLGDGGNPRDATTTPDGSTSPDGGTNPDGSTTPDGSTGDGGGGATSVMCGNSSCALPGPCCIVNGTTPACISDGGSCQQGDVALQCASNADCPSTQVCCLDATNQNTPAAVCSTTCTGQDHAVICDPNGTAQANRCGDAGACTTNNNGTWGLPNNGYGVCGNSQGPF